ncbi:PLP-dependent aminotransferase family protein [Kineosporia sp. J2-2]|uniref:PLP-dependent aminotransferase family protein n=1 Tax=Kineosporia corallincola TaxID=2835133 RepID=A0ABS5TGS7_9ACTN|nr:PLP-dependent aminotransferase family protein [Kineosporia corallincola]MBT0770245.1 PLP-dependent aminotransferase family protein [Kineosporia corallincola]
MNDGSSARITADLRAWVESASPGARLPSNRELCARHGAGPVTVQKAVRALTELGLIESRPGVGTFVRPATSARPIDHSWQTSTLGAAPIRTALASSQRPITPGAIALHAGYPDRELLPERLVRSAVTRASRSEAAVRRAPVHGEPELQAWFAGELARTTAAGVQPPRARDVLILSGSQSGLSSVFRAVVGPGRPLLIESPTYWGAILAAAQAGVRLVPLATGPQGPSPEAVGQALRETGARAFYAQPTYANPTGAQWPSEVSQGILDVLRGHHAFLIEDDWAHDLAIDSDPTPVAGHDDSGHVIYLRSPTKSVSPALRVAAVIARGPALERISADRATETMYVSSLLQAAALDVVTQPAWRSHLRRLRQHLRARRDLLAESLREHLPGSHLELLPRGGLNLWLRLPDGADPHALSRATEARGVVIAPGTEWFPAEPSGPYVRLNYSGPDPGRFPEAARILATSLRDTGVQP